MANRACKRKGCTTKVLARGLCSKHYQQEPDQVANGKAWYEATKPELQVRFKRNYEENREQRRWQNMSIRFGLDADSFSALLLGQGNACAICGRAEPGGNGGWHVDHDHACCPRGRACHRCIRGLLCNRCNLGLGHFKDDAAILRAAADYLDRFAAKAA